MNSLEKESINASKTRVLNCKQNDSIWKNDKNQLAFDPADIVLDIMCLDSLSILYLLLSSSVFSSMQFTKASVHLVLVKQHQPISCLNGLGILICVFKISNRDISIGKSWKYDFYFVRFRSHCLTIVSSSKSVPPSNLCLTSREDETQTNP